MRFLHTGDWHIGRVLAPQRYGAAFAQKRRLELLAAAEKIVALANDEDVDLVLCAGDLFHSEQVRYDELRDLNAILSQLKRARFVVAPGNHDPLLPNDNYQRLDWCPPLPLAPAGRSTLNFPELDCCVHCYGWAEKEQPQPLLEDWQPKSSRRWNLLLLHGDALSWPSRYLPLSLTWLQSLGMDYVALGHIHQPQVLAENIRYCGSPEPMTLGESGEHGCWLCELSDQGLSAKLLPIAQRHCLSLTVEQRPDQAFWQLRSTIREQARQQGLENFYSIRLEGQRSLEHPLDLELLRQELLGDGVLCQLEDHSQPDYDLELLLEENRNNLLGTFLQSFEGKALSETEDLARRLGLEALLQEKRKQP